MIMIEVSRKQFSFAFKSKLSCHVLLTAGKCKASSWSFASECELRVVYVGLARPSFAALVCTEEGGDNPGPCTTEV